jgi:hypothetical protein
MRAAMEKLNIKWFDPNTNNNAIADEKLSDGAHAFPTPFGCGAVTYRDEIWGAK